MYVKVLNGSNAKSYAKLIDSLWPYHYPGSEEYIALMLEINGGFGLFTKSTDQLVSWVLLNCLGDLGLLQTLEECQRKGYGSIMIRVASQKIGLEGGWCCGAVSVDNGACQTLLRKIGFTDIANCQYIMCNKQ